MQVALAAGVLGAIVATAPGAQAATKRTDKREIDARQAFAAGQYQKALDLYAELYADSVHPTYLRNIGRCYQNLREPGKSINAFRDYLRQAKGLSAAERAEVEGYIAEMEALEKQQAAEAAAATAPTPPPPTPTLPLVPPVTPEGQAGGDAFQITQPLSEEPPPSKPFYKKAWFWSVVGVAVVGGVVGGLYAGGVFSKSSIACKAADNCF